MSSILDRLVRPVQSQPDPEPLEHPRHVPGDHDALHCHLCPPEFKILQATMIQNAILQQLLRKFEEAESVPKGDPFVYTVTSPVQNTVYTSPAMPFNGVLRSFVIGGPQNVSVWISSPTGTAIATQGNPTTVLPGATLVCKAASTGVAVPFANYHVAVPVGAVFQISTDGTGAFPMYINAWIEPVSAEGHDFFRFRR